MQKNSSKNEKKGNRKGFALLAAVCALAAVFGIVWIIKYIIVLNKSGKEFDSLKNSYVQESITVSETEKEPESLQKPEESVTEEKEAEQTDAAALEEERKALLEKYQVPEREVNFTALQEEQNADIYAWITIPDTQIDYPILQSEEELDYYLEHNLDGSTGLPGCIYTQMINSRDFTDPNTVIYGHNMKNGSMFANLHYYEDSQFFEEHPYVYIYMPEKILVYEVFAAYEFPGVHLLMGFDVNTEESFAEYLQNIYGASGMKNQFNQDIKEELSGESRIITLSTCIGNKSDKRWLVAALLRERIPEGL